MKIKNAEPVIKSILLFAFLILIARLFYLQIYSQQILGDISKKNILRNITVDPLRGNIFDRNHNLILSNQPLYSVIIEPYKFRREDIALVANVLKITEYHIVKIFNDGTKANRFAPIPIKRDIDVEELTKISENLWKIQGVQIVIQSKRKYHDIRSTHFLGYVKPISKDILDNTEEGYSQNDVVGYNGIEQKYEQYLKGTKGYRLIVVNNKGKYISEFNNGKQNIPAREGDDLITSIDVKMQRMIEHLFDSIKTRGSVIVMNPKTGDILSIVSYPFYDPNSLQGVIDSKAWNALLTDKSKPLLDRTVQTLYPPGSTYKMVSAIAAIEENVVSENWSVFCGGSFRFGNKVFKCHAARGHGTVSMHKAIKYSCNVYFYQLMLKIGLDRWSKYGRMFGFGEKTGIDISQEKTAILPSKKYLDQLYGVGKWTDGYLVSLGIGQGELITTPMQVLNYASMLATKGTIVQPHIINERVNKSTGVIEPIHYKSSSIKISERTWDIVRSAMLDCVEDGTGKGSKTKGISIAGKTGTAQNPHGDSHSWFLGFGPYENPELAVVVFLENGGSGGKNSAPISAKIFKYWADHTKEGKAYMLQETNNPQKKQQRNLSQMYTQHENQTQSR